ncbi:hypothetical protein INS49_007457 [Diaporthe citri]|uniref:uncharacterized protein n=1 Tax=Diaporthe citri TaxID=83186 RepID=UPI001C81710A|nr:uncharacterized protein INS49_007457 [Diaporthe citri]KAG6353377.1 hypothetical protein INS49_007457 [Diaporthe citri]
MAGPTLERPIRISIDRGGTFTDCVAVITGQEDIVIKILSVDPRNYPDAPTEAIRLVLERFYGKAIPRGAKLDLKDVEWVRMGTTVATNALLERKGERTAFLVTRGFKDVLQIGNQSRPYMFDLAIRRPSPLYSDAFEVDERAVLQSCADSDLRTMRLEPPEPLETVVGTSGETVQVVEHLDTGKTRDYLRRIYDEGFRSIAVCLMHSYIFPRHELQIAELAREVGFEHITLSHQVSQRPKLVPRGNSVVVDAYLTPAIKKYLSQFSASFPGLEQSGARLEFMQSDGGLVPASTLRGLHSILSGPAGGVVGYSQTCYDEADKVPTIGFDMGGTSTDVSRYDGKLDHIFETTTAGISIHAPQLNSSDSPAVVPKPSSLVVDVSPPQAHNISTAVLDPVALSVFRHRFMGVAEQMGRVLQNFSVSANIKERLDFSCAIFTPDGSLVANAPHVPAMIGTFGGTHLPDLTIVTPVFDAQGKEIVFWAASRGHHADVGGIRPGSMPPSSKFLWEEGAVFDSFLLVRDGVFAEKELQRLLCEEPAKMPGTSGTRCFQDNVTDLKAQVAANHTGIRLVRQLIEEYTMDVVQMYMGAIQDSAELAIRNLFKKLAVKTQGSGLHAIDHMDDGTPIQLQVTIDADSGSALFDFTGTGPEVYGNWNAPEAICNSAVIYALRCMVDSDIPLNHGCIRPMTLVTPEHSLLKPEPPRRRRIVDVIFRAFGACAASQGCMNNLTFGLDGEGGFGYYATIAGGSGAGPSWHGTSGVHTNMTNTRITDPESLERRYPVDRERRGQGAYRGGEGVIRDVGSRVPMSASIPSERRSFAPYGMEGGGEGGRGRNTWVQRDGRRINIGGKNSIKADAGDRLVVETPGGGGYGVIQDGGKEEQPQTMTSFVPVAGGSVGATRDLAEQV